MMINHHLIAAQTKLVIAQAIGDTTMWDQAMHSMKNIFEATKKTEERMILGHAIHLSKLNLEDVICNYEMYGDLTVVDGDLLLAQSKINTVILN